MGGDYTAVTSAYDLSLGKVDHWCLDGGNDNCRCDDPLEPQARSEYRSWTAAHKANKEEVGYYRAVYGMEPTLVDVKEGGVRHKLDVAFVGER